MKRLPTVAAAAGWHFPCPHCGELNMRPMAPKTGQNVCCVFCRGKVKVSKVMDMVPSVKMQIKINAQAQA